MVEHRQIEFYPKHIEKDVQGILPCVESKVGRGTTFRVSLPQTGKE
jgi:hypothetical protein